jgi:hypothetical protein
MGLLKRISTTAARIMILQVCPFAETLTTLFHRNSLKLTWLTLACNDGYSRERIALHKKWDLLTYHSAGFVVVKVKCGSNVATFFTSVDKFAREFNAKLDVVGTATPFPIGSWRSSLAVVASARFNSSFRTGSRHGMSHGSRHQRVDESRFAASCEI